MCIYIFSVGRVWCAVRMTPVVTYIYFFIKRTDEELETLKNIGLVLWQMSNAWLYTAIQAFCGLTFAVYCYSSFLDSKEAATPQPSAPTSPRVRKHAERIPNYPGKIMCANIFLC